MGWKRLEGNRVLRFTGVTEENFPSIWRRFAVVRIMARFFDAVSFARLPVKGPEYGFFQRDPTAKEFVKSGPAIAAGHKYQWAFEVKHGREALEYIMYDYVNGGGDNNETQRTLREACGLSP